MNENQKVFLKEEISFLIEKLERRIKFLQIETNMFNENLNQIISNTNKYKEELNEIQKQE